MKPIVAIINAALAGRDGNTATLLDRANDVLQKRAEVLPVTITAKSGFSLHRDTLSRADAFLVGTGTHWDSWSSHLQRFLEDATPTEGTALWLGKPAGVVVTMHSVGGKGVLSRLQGVLNTFGCVLPPMSGMVYSLVNQQMIESGAPAAEDLWCPADVDIICHNLLEALKPKPKYQSWPVDRVGYSTKWIHEAR